MPTSQAKQKKALKHKKKRDAARQKARETTRLALRPSEKEMLRMAAGRPLGPAFLSESLDALDPALPELVSVIVTRWGPGQMLLGALVLVDRTCLGVKNAMLFPPQTEAELEARVARMGEMIGTLRRVEPLVAQSVVYNSIDYARALGFAPHRDFPEAIFGPRPEVLLATPLARLSRPLYMPGPDDDVRGVLAKLSTAVGPEGFDVTAPMAGIDLLDEEDDKEVEREGDEDDEDDEDDVPG
jgi:hypothetical protein